ncbi:MAG TPA: hypothetical protein VMZ28_02555 [Kofleriaceae bacterium]|nr:hypothetical protein [Kofleriaceae bacterium]
MIAGALVAALGAVPAAAHAQQQQPRVGVVVLVHTGLSASEADGVSDALGRGLRARLLVDVIAGAEVTRRLPPEAVAGSCMIEKECTADLAQRLAVDQLLYLVVNRIGGRVSVDATWVDPATMRTVPRPQLTFDKIEQAEAAFAEAAPQVLPDAAPRPAAAVTPTPEAGGGDTVIHTDPQPVVIEQTTPRHMTRGAWIAAGVGVAAAGGALTFTLLARKDYVDCDDSGTCSDSKLDRLERKALAADVLWGASVAAAVTAGALWWLSSDVERVETGAPVAIEGGPAGSLGLSLRGSL